MDPVRFGRVLGVGTREVAKALVRAADAAAAPNPEGSAHAQKATVGGERTPVGRSEASRGQAREVVRTVTQARTDSVRMFAVGREAGRQALAPVSRAAGVLWFEITGVFFGIFAAGMGFEVWHRRLDFLAPGDARVRAWMVLGIGLMFTWFTVSSFVRARRRNRR